MIDEMSGSTMPFNLFKTLIHQGCMIANIKNDSVPVAARFIGICSNFWLEHWWNSSKKQSSSAEVEEGCLNYHSIWRVIDEIRIYYAFRHKPKRGDPWDSNSNNVLIKRDEDVDGDGAILKEKATTVFIDKNEGFYNKARFVPPPEKATTPPSGSARPASAKKTGSASGTTTTHSDGTN